MDTRKIVQKSVNVLVEYYENNIQPFEDAMDDDILWIGPLQGQMIRGKKNLVNTYALEEHDLTFDVFDMQASVVYSTKQHCEVLLTFIVDTHYPDQSVIRCHQRVLLSWQHYIEHTESGKRISHDLIHNCFISNAIPADTRDTIIRFILQSCHFHRNSALHQAADISHCLASTNNNYIYWISRSSASRATNAAAKFLHWTVFLNQQNLRPAFSVNILMYLSVCTVCIL